MFSAAANKLIAWWNGAALIVIDPNEQSPSIRKQNTHPKTHHSLIIRSNEDGN